MSIKREMLKNCIKMKVLSKLSGILVQGVKIADKLSLEKLEMDLYALEYSLNLKAKKIVMEQIYFYNRAITIAKETQIMK